MVSLVSVTVVSPTSGNTLWSGRADPTSWEGYEAIREGAAATLEVPVVSVDLWLGAELVDPASARSQHFKRGMEEVTFSAVVDASIAEAAQQLNRFRESMPTTLQARVPDEVLHMSEVADMLKSITSGLGLKELPSEAAAWLKVLLACPQILHDETYNFSIDARLFAGKQDNSRWQNHLHEWTSADGLLYLGVGSPDQDDRTLWIVDVSGQLAETFGGAVNGGGVWFVWANDEQSICGTTAETWRSIRDQLSTLPDGQWALVTLPGNQNFRLLQKPRLVAPGLVKFFDYWLETGHPPYDAFIPLCLRGNSDAVVKAAQAGGRRSNNALSIASEELRADKCTVLEVVKVSGRQLQYASAELRDDRDVVTAAINSDRTAFEFASDELRSNKALLMLALDEASFDYDSYRLIRFASEELLKDPDVIRAALEADGNALQFFSEAVRGNRDFLKSTVDFDADPEAFQWVAAELKEDKAFLEYFVKENAERDPSGPIVKILEFASEKVRGDREFMLPFLEMELAAHRGYKLLSADLRNDRELALQVMNQQYGACCISYCSAELRADTEIIKTALSLWPPDGCDDNFECCAFKYASEDLRANREFVAQAIAIDPICFMYASDAIRADRNLALQAVQTNGHMLRYASTELRADRELVQVAIQTLPDSLEFASKDLRAEFCEQAAAVHQHQNDPP